MQNPLRLPVFVFLLLVSSKCSDIKPKGESVQKELTEEQVIERYLKKGAWNYSYFMPQWGVYIDSAIAVNPNIAYLYQQRAMPYFKQSKYEAGMRYLDKAVALDPSRYIDYRAFIKCIFSKSYEDAIHDFEVSKKIKGDDGYVMDHSYDFYLGLCHLQLNNFDKAIACLERSVDLTFKRYKSKEWVHHLDNFYLGIAHYEAQHYEKAISYFEDALASYPTFSDATYYKAMCMFMLRRDLAEISTLVAKCEHDFKAGYTINEDNSFYEQYPYQIKQWHINILKP